ncbi:protein PHYTOCHROME-DEPENDENT LATE-FLOWERING [Rutidosis leptorrhynchoides]|uniref:protein PHYTOCHROME-DEPENDENT LATE-FLOWERING n=1 Tax=Rutidosis leptorrhynchoides TaxID=125765 RepID=UPI003A9A2FAA
MPMKVSFKVSKTGARFRPKPKPKSDIHTPLHEDEDINISTQNHKISSVSTNLKPSVDVTEEVQDAAEILDADVSFYISLYPDGYSIGNPSENRSGPQDAVQDDPKYVHPYDRTSESLFLSIERGMLPADFLDDIPCKYINGAVACEVRDYRNCGFEPGVNGSSANASPTTTKIRLKMSLDNVVKDIPLISDSSWTYGDLMEVEARILMALQPKLDLDPTPNFNKLCRPPTSTNLNLNIRELRRKRLRQLSGSDNLVNGKKVCMDRTLENSSAGQILQQPSDAMNMSTQNVGPSIPVSPSLSYPSKYQIGTGNQRLMQDHGQDIINSYADSMNTNITKRENQDGQLSPMASLTKRGRSNSMGLDGTGQQQQTMDGYNSLMQQQSTGRGIQLPNNTGIQKYPFEGGFNQDPFTMGQQGVRYNLKQEAVDSELNRTMHMMDSDVDPRLQQQRMTQHISRSSFPPTPWNNNMDNSRKEEQFQRRKSAQSPRVSSGALPQSPLSSKSGEFSSGSHGGQYGVTAPRDKSAVTSGPTVGGQVSMTANAQIAARRSNSLPKTQAMNGIGSSASASNMSGGPFNSTSSLVGKDADKSMRDKFSKIEMLTVRYQLNCKKNKVDEYRKTTVFPTSPLNHYLYNDHNNNENPKDDTCKMPLSKSLVGGSMNVCKTRVLTFLQHERVLQGNVYTLVPKSRTRMILSEKCDDGTVAMHYGELDDCDYLAEENCLPTLPNTHVADLLAAQFCTLILREGYHVEADQLQPKPTNVVRSSGDLPNNNASGVLSPNTEIPETVSGQPSNEAAKPSDTGTISNSSVITSGTRMHPPVNSQPLQIAQNGLLPTSRPMQSESQQSFQQHHQHNLMQRSSAAMMLASNPLSHINAMGQNSNMQQLGHMLNKPSPLQLQLLQQQQQQQQQQPQMQRKMMMGLGNVGIGGNTGNNMVGMGAMGGARGISPPMSGAISGMGNGMGQAPLNMNQATSISNAISQQLRSGMITPAQAAIMTTKLRMAQSRNILGAAPGQSSNIPGLTGANRQVHPGSSNYSMLGSTMNRSNNVNPMQRTAMAPPKLISGMNVYMNPQLQQQQQMNLQQLQQQQQMPHQQQVQPQLPHQQQQQQQESTSPLQAVLSPPQQVGSPSMGLPQQQASPQQMSQQRTPMSPQLSSGAIHTPMSAGNQDSACPASPQLSSQTMGSVSSMTNSPMEMQGVNKSS